MPGPLPVGLRCQSGPGPVPPCGAGDVGGAVPEAPRVGRCGCGKFWIPHELSCLGRHQSRMNKGQRLGLGQRCPFRPCTSVPEGYGEPMNMYFADSWALLPPGPVGAAWWGRRACVLWGFEPQWLRRAWPPQAAPAGYTCPSLCLCRASYPNWGPCLES